MRNADAHAKPDVIRKPDLVRAVKTAAKLNSREADRVLEALLEQVTNALSRGETISLTGFGAFVVQQRPSRTGRNPRTGQPMSIAASNRVAFRPGKALKQTVDSGNL